MSTKPFHHGNLRAALLEEAELVLRHEGVDGLSLREIARRIGVSHGAPRSHFVDRQALLDALAERGFERLTERVRFAATAEGTLEARFRRVGHAYVDFAVDDAALMDLMFAAKTTDVSGVVQAAAARLFQVLDDALDDSAGGETDGESGGETDGESGGETRVRFKLLFAAAMQGTAALIASRRISSGQGDTVIDDTVALLLASELGRRALPGAEH